MLSTAPEPALFRRAVGRFASGVTVVTGAPGGEPVGFTCQSFYSVSLEPLLVSISVMNTSTTYPNLRDHGGFCVNVLSAGQSGLSSQFARRGTDKWAGVSWSPAGSGNPVLDGSLLWLDCRITSEHIEGDHTVVIGEVLEFGEHPTETEPLLFYTGGYHRLTPHS